MASGFSEPLQQAGKTFVRWRGRKLVYFGGCDYLRLSFHPAVLRAFNSTGSRFGLTVAASRRTTGNHLLYEQVEDAARRFFSVERAILVSNGYLTNIIAAQGLQGAFDRVFIDARAHSSLRDAASFLDCPKTEFAHRGPADLQEKIRATRPRGSIAVLTDGMFAQDGSVAPLAAYRKVAGSKATLWVDDAHAAGILGQQGGGSVELTGIGRRNVIQTITFSKAFGAYGGAILCDQPLARRIVSQSTALAGGTPLPLPLVAAVLAALKAHRKEPGHRKKLRRNLELFWNEIGLKPEVLVPIISVTAKDSAALNRALLKAAIYPCFIDYGGGPFSPYFRFAISSEHTAEQIKKLARTLAASRKARERAGAPLARKKSDLLFLGVDV